MRSRRDLRLINRLMGNERWLLAMLNSPQSDIEPPHVLELGAGCGSLARQLHRRWPRIHYTAIDLAPRPADFPEAYQWHQHDLCTHPLPQADIVIANIFLHHLTDDQLRTLGRRLRGTSYHTCLFNEPARRQRHLWQGHLLGLTGLHAITKHDMAISIRAGFLAEELAQVMGFAETTDWQCDTHLTWLGAYRLKATRRT